MASSSVFVLRNASVVAGARPSSGLRARVLAHILWSRGERHVCVCVPSQWQVVSPGRFPAAFWQIGAMLLCAHCNNMAKEQRRRRLYVGATTTRPTAATFDT